MQRGGDDLPPATDSQKPRDRSGMTLRTRVKLGTQRPSHKAVRLHAHRRAIEPLEARQLLSGTAQPFIIAFPSLHGGSFNGYTPAQIRHAYGFDKVNFTGAGQTIAIVDAFDDPTILADLKVFD